MAPVYGLRWKYRDGAVIIIIIIIDDFVFLCEFN